MLKRLNKSIKSLLFSNLEEAVAAGNAKWIELSGPYSLRPSGVNADEEKATLDEIFGDKWRRPLYAEGVAVIEQGKCISTWEQRKITGEYFRIGAFASGNGRLLVKKKVFPKPNRDIAFDHLSSMLKRKTLYEKTVAVLGNSYHPYINYYHLWVDALANLYLIKKAGFDLGEIDKYLMPFNNNSWQLESLELVGLRPDQIVSYDTFETLQAKKMIIPIRTRETYNLPLWVSSALKELSINKLNIEHPGKKIYISRKDANRRRVLNEKKVTAFLKNKGFEVYCMESLSVREQQNLFASSDIIIAPHGAAFTNIIWCEPGTAIIDLMPINFRIPCFFWLSRQADLLYYPVLCKSNQENQEAINDDIVVDLAILEVVLEKCGLS